MFERAKILGYQFLRGVEIVCYGSDEDVSWAKAHDPAYFKKLEENHRRIMGTIDSRVARCYARIGDSEKASLYEIRSRERGTLDDKV